MKASKIAVATIMAGVLLGTYGLVTDSSAYQAPQNPAPVEGVASLNSGIVGLAPIDDVVELFKKRSEDHPLDYISRTHLGAALSAQAREQGNLAGYEDAERAAREALAINPRYTAAKLTLASALHSQHQFQQALQIATEVAQDEPNQLSAVALVGDANFELGNYGAARVAYDQLAAVDRSGPVLSRLSRMAWVDGDNEGALALATEALERSGDLPERPSGHAFYWFQLGHTQFASGQVDEAVASFEQALVIDPSSSGAREELAFVLFSTGDSEGAADLYRQLIGSAPAADLHGSYADVLRDLGQADLAAEQEALGERLARETIGGAPSERRHLVGFYLTRNPSLALELALADFDERHDVGAYDTLAWAKLHNGDIEGAQTAIDSALAVGTRDAAILYHAGAIAAANGDLVSARTHLQDALAINPVFHPSEARDAQELLLSLDA